MPLPWPQSARRKCMLNYLEENETHSVSSKAEDWTQTAQDFNMVSALRERPLPPFAVRRGESWVQRSRTIGLLCGKLPSPQTTLMFFYMGKVGVDIAGSQLPHLHCSRAMALLPALTSQLTEVISPLRGRAVPWATGMVASTDVLRALGVEWHHALAYPAPVSRQLQLQPHEVHCMCHWFLYFQVKL